MHVLTGTNSDSGVDISLVHDAAAGAPVGAPIRRDILFNVLAECRVTKSAGELDLMSYASWISSMAHVDVMREVHPGMLEYQLEARFLFHIAYHGNASFVSPLLHPPPHSPPRRLPSLRLHLHLRLRTQQRHPSLRPRWCPSCLCCPALCFAIEHMVICVQERPTSACCRRTISPCWTWAPSGWQRDAFVRFAHAACRYYCYCSDITCSYPVSRTFSPDQRFVYEIVLEAQKQILGAQPCRSDCAAVASSVSFC